MSEKFCWIRLLRIHRTPSAGSDGHDYSKPLIRRIVVRPAASDDADITDRNRQPHRIRRRSHPRHRRPRHLPLPAQRWANPLRERGITQTIDMHAADHGRVDHDGIAMIDGWPHCPGRQHPKRLGNRPPRELVAPKDDQDRTSAAAVAIDEYRADVAKRGTYAFTRALRLAYQSSLGGTRRTVPMPSRSRSPKMPTQTRKRCTTLMTCQPSWLHPRRRPRLHVAAASAPLSSARTPPANSANDTNSALTPGSATSTGARS